MFYFGKARHFGRGAAAYLTAQRRHLPLLNTATGISQMLDALGQHDPATLSHTLRVRHYALRLGVALGLDARQLRKLSIAAKLHDIGKLAVSARILNKPGRLDGEEYALIQGHSSSGEYLASSIIDDRTILSAIRGHHERFDGTGYPDGLVGRQIPLLARIITVADSYDAMTSLRPYGTRLSRKKALKCLRQGAGTQFDPRLVAIFVAPIAPLISAPRYDVSASSS